MEQKRCDWAVLPIEKKYHDEVWGIEEHDDLALFRMICLEGMQAGLSWHTILIKMNELDIAFDNFNPHKLIQYDENKIQSLLNNDKIIRNKLKIKAMISNAHAYFKLIKEQESLDKYLYSFINNHVIINLWDNPKDIPTTTNISDEISKELKKYGFKFFGSTTTYAFMQAIGMVDDHQEDCYKRNQ